MYKIDLLPSDPEQFFALQTGNYDRRELKRSYGKAIRQFKPDEHPAEFQLIRQAYERLERALRYQADNDRSEQANSAWQRLPTIPPSANSAEPASTFPNLKHDSYESQSIEQLAIANPNEAFAQLRRQPSRTPQEYYLTAVLTDFSHSDQRHPFLMELLDGLAIHSNDPGLMSLTLEYVRNEISDDELIDAICLIAERNRTPLCYALTETLWTRLVRQRPFESWSKELDSFESKLRQTSPRTRACFSIRLLHSAIWNAPRQWTHDRLTQIESNSAHLDEASQYELEFLEAIGQILEHTSPETESNAVRRHLLTLIKSHCEANEGEAIGVVVPIIAELVRDPTTFRDAFPMNHDPSIEGWVTAVQILVNELSPYTIQDEHEQRNDNQPIIRLLKELEPTVVQVLNGQERARSKYYIHPMIAWSLIGTLVGSLFTIPIALMFNTGDLGVVLCAALIVMWLVAMLLSYYRWLYPKYLKARHERMTLQWLLEGYSQFWRQRLFRLAQTTDQPIGHLLNQINHLSKATMNTNTGNTVHYFATQDAGLIIFVSLRSLL